MTNQCIYTISHVQSVLIWYMLVLEVIGKYLVWLANIGAKSAFC